MGKKKAQHKINGAITVREVRLGEHGIIPLRDALKLAEDSEMDLVMINESTSPPICKLLNYEKFIYEQSKKQKNKVLDMKEIKLGPNISDNDIEYRVKHGCEFLKKGHKVKITVQFRGREMQHTDLGSEQILKMVVALEEFGVAEAMPKLEGKKMYCIVRPISKK
jgi:translation initiation factor IF-3